MNEIMVVVNSKGQITIPAGVRENLKIEHGTRLALSVENNRSTLQPINEKFVRSLVGCCKGETSLVMAREREHKREDRKRHQKLRSRFR
jgi:AbrB family looped-hinge helix DNA binding protein